MQPTDYSSHLSVHTTYILQSELHIKGEITIITPNHWWSFKSAGIIVQIYCLFSTLHQTNDDRAPSRILPILSGREQLDVPSEPIKRFLHQWDLLLLHHFVNTNKSKSWQFDWKQSWYPDDWVISLRWIKPKTNFPSKTALFCVIQDFM